MYANIVKYFQDHPKDVHTVPLKGEPRWFYVYAENENLYVEVARMHTPSSSIKGRRLLVPAQCETMLNIYQRRKKGEHVSKEASRATRCQVYWYGIFAELGL